MSQGKIVDICIELLDEGTPTLKIVKAIEQGKDIYKLIVPSDYDPEDETWEFLPGSLVRCEKKMNDLEEILLAVEQVG